MARNKRRSSAAGLYRPLPPLKTPKRPSPTEELERMKREILQQAEEEDWGPLTGEAVVGQEIIYTFSRRQVVCAMPANSEYPRGRAFAS